MINIPFRILQAAIICVPRADIRYYLNGVYIDHKRLAGTDGHRLFSYYHVAPNEGFEPFIMPRNAVTDLAKLLTPKQKRENDVEFSVVDDQPQIKCDKYIIEFDPLDGKYPNIDKVIPAQKKASAHYFYNWKYMYDFDRIDKILTGLSVAKTKLIPYGINGALVKLSDPNATAVVMPMRG